MTERGSDPCHGYRCTFFILWRVPNMMKEELYTSPKNSF